MGLTEFSRKLSILPSKLYECKEMQYLSGELGLRLAEVPGLWIKHPIYSMTSADWP